jgi:hypothetical protein
MLPIALTKVHRATGARPFLRGSDSAPTSPACNLDYLRGIPPLVGAATAHLPGSGPARHAALGRPRSRLGPRHWRARCECRPPDRPLLNPADHRGGPGADRRSSPQTSPRTQMTRPQHLLTPGGGDGDCLASTSRGRLRELPASARSTRTRTNVECSETRLGALSRLGQTLAIQRAAPASTPRAPSVVPARARPRRC